jgi:hypothetical protein
VLGRLPTGALVCIALAALLAGCGDDGDLEGTTFEESTTRLTRAESRVIAVAQRRVQGYCADRAQALFGEGEPPSAHDLREVDDALVALARLAARRPEAESAAGVTPRLALGDIAENLEGTNCDQRLVARIDSLLAGLPGG